MSYKSLLFCPHQGTAQLLTQILTELEFSIETAAEPFGAVKKLSDEHFDALVVDCQSEQDAALLFKTARDSAQNHGSLSVAVVEGQTGIAKAFRIGANLVLTKPINVEQSKGTLRVARGLLKKNDAKPPATVPSLAPPKPVTQSSGFSTETPAPVPLQQYAPVANLPVAPAKPEVPYSGLVLESDPTPVADAAEAAVLESLPELGTKSAKEIFVQPLGTVAEPIAGGSGLGAATAPALEKSTTLGLSIASASPMVTNEPIVAEARFDATVTEPVSTEPPAFSSLESSHSGSGVGPKLFKTAVVLTIVGVAAFYGWLKMKPTILQKIRGTEATKTVAATASQPAAETTPSLVPSQPVATEHTSVPDSPAAKDSVDEAIDARSPDANTSSKRSKIESIEVQEMPMPGDPKAPAVKPEPLVVKPDSGSRLGARAAQGPAPQLALSNVNVAPQLPAFSSTPALPKLAEGLRVSQGVSQGLLLKKVAPVYPPMALRLHKEGSVEMLATISKQGSITAVKVLTGDAVLAKSAADAVRQWKYRPYLLNGEPVEIQTQVTIVFKAP